jgi:hypothetical protein
MCSTTGCGPCTCAQRRAGRRWSGCAQIGGGAGCGGAEWNAANPRWCAAAWRQPVCFGIAFTATLLNQAEALVHVYVDGTVVVTTGAIEMGQGVVQGKIRRVTARTLGVPSRWCTSRPPTRAGGERLRDRRLHRLRSQRGRGAGGVPVHRGGTAPVAAACWAVRPRTSSSPTASPASVPRPRWRAGPCPAAPPSREPTLSRASPRPARRGTPPRGGRWRGRTSSPRRTCNGCGYRPSPTTRRRTCTSDRETNTGRPFHYHVLRRGARGGERGRAAGNHHIDRVTCRPRRRHPHRRAHRPRRSRAASCWVSDWVTSEGSCTTRTADPHRHPLHLQDPGTPVLPRAGHPPARGAEPGWG